MTGQSIILVEKERHIIVNTKEDPMRIEPVALRDGRVDKLLWQIRVVSMLHHLNGKVLIALLVAAVPIDILLHAQIHAISRRLPASSYGYDIMVREGGEGTCECLHGVYIEIYIDDHQ